MVQLRSTQGNQICALMNLFLENSPMVHLHSTQVNQIGLSNGAITKHPGQSDLSLQWCNYKAPRAIRFDSPMVHLHMHLICLSNGAFTKHPGQSDLSLQWCIYTCTCSHERKKHFFPPQRQGPFPRSRATLPPFPHFSATPSPGMGRGG